MKNPHLIFPSSRRPLRFIAGALSVYCMLMPARAEENILGTVQEGIASRYRATAKGLTMAHLTLPKGTSVNVTNLDNDKSACVVVRDRGPYRDRKHRIADLSDEAADAVGLTLKKGLTPIKLRVVESCPK